MTAVAVVEVVEMSSMILLRGDERSFTIFSIPGCVTTPPGQGGRAYGGHFL